MKIGLIRHFQVIQYSKKFMTSKEFEEWVKIYDNAEIKIIDMSGSEVEWDICYSSNLSRAVKTAESIFEEEIIKKEILREIPIASVIRKNILLPHKIWLILGRLAYLFSHKSQPESIDETKVRVKNFISEIVSLEESNILIVSHGFVMKFLQKELIRNGFKGEKFNRAKNGQIYLFEK